MAEFDIDRTTAEDRLMKAIRRAECELKKAIRIAKKLNTITTDIDGNRYCNGKMPDILEACQIHAEGCHVMMEIVQEGLERVLPPYEPDIDEMPEPPRDPMWWKKARKRL